MTTNPEFFKGWLHFNTYETGKETKMEQKNLFGVLTNFKLPQEFEPPFKLEAKAWKGLWDFKHEEPTELVVTSTHGYKLINWHEDVDGGPGLCVVIDFESPNGKQYNVQVIIPKDELIKALALLVE